MKSYQRGVGGGTASTVSSGETKREPIQAQTSEKAEEKITEPVPAIENTETAEGENKIEFQGLDLNLEEGEFTYEEKIPFIPATDKFEEVEVAKMRLQALADLLKQHQDVHVTIIGNTASTAPSNIQIYGDSEESLNATAKLNGKYVKRRDLMLARAKRVYQLLVDSGVNESQLDYKTGSHRQTKEERVVTFVIVKPEFE